MGVRGQGYLYRPAFRTKAGERRLVSIWYWKAPTGRRYTTGQTSEAEAEHWVAERLTELRDGLPVTVAAAPLRYDDLEQMLLDDWTAKERHGMLQARARLKHLNRAFSGWHAAAITTDKITRYALRRRQEGAAAATVNVEIALLHRGFVLAKRAGRLRDVPIMDRLPGVGHRTNTIERGDLEAILAHLAGKYRPVIWLLYWTGWRLSEGLGLTWRRADLEAGELRLDNSKTGEPRLLAFGPDSALARLLRDVATSRQALSPYVFPGRAGHRMDRTAIEKAWRAARTAAGIPGKPIMHDLRRTMTRDLSRAGVPLAVAMSTVGHRSLTVHQGYRIVAARDQEDGLARLEVLRAGEPVQRRFAVMGGVR